jgi:hypothetical protein
VKNQGCVTALLIAWILEATAFVCGGALWGVASLAGGSKLGGRVAIALVLFAIAIVQLVPAVLILTRRLRLRPDRVEESIIDIARGTDGTVTEGEVATWVGFSPEEASQTLNRMAAKGLAERTGRTEWLIKAVTARKVQRSCPYCGASLPVRERVLVCPQCGGNVDLDRRE